MNPVLIWDIPTRAFHWLLALGFTAAASIALLSSEHGALFPYHAIIGLTLALLVGMRIIWGFLGTRHARFGSFIFGPRALLDYVGGHFTGRSARYIGHNPGSAVAIFALLVLVLALAGTGFMLGRGDERFEEVHEILAYTAMAVAGVHLLGVAIHTAIYREHITLSMIHGRKVAAASDSITAGRGGIALLGLVIASLWAIGLINNLDPANQRTTLPLTGLAIQLGESEGFDQSPAGKRSDAQVDDDD